MRMLFSKGWTEPHPLRPALGANQPSSDRADLHGLSLRLALQDERQRVEDRRSFAPQAVGAEPVAVPVVILEAVEALRTHRAPLSWPLDSGKNKKGQREARKAGLRNPLAGMPPPPKGFKLDAR
jgi:hypothetical protein